MSIVVLGTVFVDIKGYPLDVYIPGGRNAGRVEQVHGGVGRNIAEDVANVELHPIFVGLVDGSGTGADVIRKLNTHKVDTRFMRSTPDGMGTWLAVFNNSGDVCAAISKRPNLEPMADILDEYGDEIFRDADSILLEMDMEKRVVKKAIQLARKHNRPLFGVISNMTIAVQRRDLLQSTDCFVCNRQEAGILFSEDYDGISAEKLQEMLVERVRGANIPCLVVTLGEDGAVYANMKGESGFCPAKKVDVKDTTGAGDAFFAGVSIGLTYGKTLSEACEIGSRLAASVICSWENVCPRFLPGEFGLDLSAAETKQTGTA